MIQFPWVLDMEPYTAEGMARKDAESNADSEEQEVLMTQESRAGETPPMEITIGVIPENKQINYELVGVVVHSGQANAGHYYSFIKERRYDNALCNFIQSCDTSMYY